MSKWIQEGDELNRSAVSSFFQVHHISHLSMCKGDDWGTGREAKGVDFQRHGPSFENINNTDVRMGSEN